MCDLQYAIDATSDQIKTTLENKKKYLHVQNYDDIQQNRPRNFFMSCPAHTNPLIRNTGIYTLEDLHRQYPKYRHKHINP